MQVAIDDGLLEVDTPGWQYAVAGGILGWVLDAFDFFIIVFLFNELSSKFGVSKTAIVASLTLTLAMRPWGRCCLGRWRTGLDGDVR